jgi:glyoxylase-like metal-dependent hydrolase (beta-lactamase superfamily II)
MRSWGKRVCIICHEEGRNENIMKKILIISGAVIGGIILVCAILIGIGYFKYMSIDAVKIDPQVKVYVGGGGNSLVLTSKEGDSALVVDTKMGKAAEKMRAKIMARDIIVVNTHVHRDHTGGNKLYPGAYVISGSYTKEQWTDLAAGVRYPDETVGVGETKTILLGGETVQIRNMGSEHTYDDIVVYLVNRKLLLTGDLVFRNGHPVLSAEKGTVIQKWIATLDTLYAGYDIKTLVPGHGPIADKKALADMKEYFTSIRDAIGDNARLAQLKNKYKTYYGLPGMSSFEITVRSIQQELKK